MSKKPPVNNFEWIEDTSQFTENFVKSYNKESDEGYFLKSVVKIQKLHNGLPFLPERMKTENVKKLNKLDKTEYFSDIRNLKQALNHILVLKNFIE